MEVDGLAADVEVGGNFFVALSLYEKLHYLAFSGGQFVELFFNLGSLSAFDANLTYSAFFEKNDRALNNQFFGGGARILEQDLAVFETALSKRAWLACRQWPPTGPTESASTS